MTFSYSGDPSMSEVDALRFYIGDVNASNYYLSDEELTFLFDTYETQFGHILGVAALAAEMIAAKVAGEVDVNADGVSVAVGQLQQRYNDLAASLRDQYRNLSMNGAMDAVEVDLTLDTTIPELSFGIGFMDNPEAGQQDYGRSGGTGSATVEV